MKEEKITAIEILKEAHGNALDIYSVLYQKCIENRRSAPQILQEIMEYSEEVGVNDDASKIVSKEQEEKYTKMYRELLWDETETLAKRNLSKEEFYQELWVSIFESDTAPDNEQKGAVCLKILNEEVPFVPYYQAVGVIRMESDEYEKRVRALTPNIQESIHMFNRRFEQKTEATSQFCRIIRALDEKDAAVYLATLLSILKKAYVEEGYKRAIKEMKEQSETDEEQG